MCCKERGLLPSISDCAAVGGHMYCKEWTEAAGGAAVVVEVSNRTIVDGGGGATMLR
jgi:hypothetical protein